MVCAIGNEKGEISARTEMPTITPEETMPGMIEYFKKAGVEALGIGSFGPIDLNKNSGTYGYITTTPKLAWRNYDILGAFSRALGVPCGFDTDVNAAALGEVIWGAAKGLNSAIYVTVGTGVGVGVYSNGGLLHGMLHPEAGHILLGRHISDNYAGKCPYHHNCLEGMAAGPAIAGRWGRPAAELVEREEVWKLEAYYIAQALVNYVLTLSPERIILGGGVMKQEKLFPLIRKSFIEQLAGYIVTDRIKDIDTYIVPAALGGDQGIKGCIALTL